MKKERTWIIGISVIILYLLSSTIAFGILDFLNIDYNNFNNISKSIYIIFYEALLTFIIILIYKKDIIPNFKDFIKNIKSYFNKYFKYWFMMIGLMLLSNSIITIFTTSEIANNQETIIDSLHSFPIYTIIVTVFIAPILEELVFRLSIKKIISHSNYLFIIFSGILFGSMHVITSLENLTDLLFIIPYSIPGFIFAYLYTKSKNIFVPISIHFIHNTVMMIAQIIIMLI